MSTIASPRDPSTPFPRRINSSTQIPKSPTPTSSNRPSLDFPTSANASPNPNAAAPAPSKRANRAALREYYNLKKAGGGAPGTPSLEVTEADADVAGSHYSEVPLSELDQAGFNVDAYVEQALAESSLSDLLRTYTRVLGETRALDAEKKALVYDNYSKLISATETIRKMRSNMDPLNPMARTLDAAVAKIYEEANGIREELRRTAQPPPSTTDSNAQGEDTDMLEKRRRTKELAEAVLRIPAQMRNLVDEGNLDEAQSVWELPRRLLERWKEQGVGGRDVEALIEEGDAILGEHSNHGSGTSTDK